MTSREFKNTKDAKRLTTDKKLSTALSILLPLLYIFFALGIEYLYPKVLEGSRQTLRVQPYWSYGVIIITFFAVATYTYSSMIKLVLSKQVKTSIAWLILSIFIITYPFYLYRLLRLFISFQRWRGPLSEIHDYLLQLTPFTFIRLAALVVAISALHCLIINIQADRKSREHFQ